MPAAYFVESLICALQVSFCGRSALTFMMSLSPWAQEGDSWAAASVHQRWLTCSRHAVRQMPQNGPPCYRSVRLCRSLAPASFCSNSTGCTSDVRSGSSRSLTSLAAFHRTFYSTCRKPLIRGPRRRLFGGCECATQIADLQQACCRTDAIQAAHHAAGL